MLDNKQHFLVVDLEATCTNDNAFSRHEMEVIEIGAVMVRGADMAVVAEHQTFIKPVRYPKLTAFCTELTSITQHNVDTAEHFPAAFATFVAWIQRFTTPVFCSWGDYDRKQIQQDCDYHAIDNPMPMEHMNIKAMFSAALGLKKRLGMARALKHVGITLEGTHHRGIDDARNIAKLLPYALKRRTL